MTFNKKLLALAIAHFAFAQFVFASDDEMEVQKVSKTAVAAAKYVESGLVSLNSYVNLDKAVFKGSEVCQGCGDALLRASRGTTTLALGLLGRADILSGGRIAKAKVLIAGYEKQAVEYGQSKNYRRIVGAYQWLKENAQYVMFAPAEKQE